MERSSLRKAHPLAYYSFLQALRRYDTSSFARVQNKLGVDLSKVASLVNTHLKLSEAPLRELTSLIVHESSYADIAFFAGEYAFSASNFSISGASVRATLLSALGFLKEVLPGISYEVSSFRVPSVKLFDSPFVVRMSASPTCGFIAGFLTSAFIQADTPQRRVVETFCASVEPHSTFCHFEVVNHFINLSRVKR